MSYSANDQPRRVTEPEYTKYIRKLIDPDEDVYLAKTVVDGLTCKLNAGLRSRFGPRLWGWQLGRAATDLGIVNDDNVALAFVEFKSLTAAANVIPLRNLRALKVMQGPQKEVLQTILDSTDCQFDEPHGENDCVVDGSAGCTLWRSSRGTDGLHEPVVTSADFYSAARGGTYDQGPNRDGDEWPIFLLIAPSERSREKFAKDRKSDWECVLLADSLRYWESALAKGPGHAGLEHLIATTRHFLAI